MKNYVLTLLYFVFSFSFLFCADLNERLADHIQFNAEGPNKVGYLAIDNRDAQISQATFIYVKNALDYYKKTKPAFIILDLNTPGGEVFAAQKISDALKDMDTNQGIPTVAFIDNWAISAGAMLAYSSRFITTVKDGSMGAAEPVLQSQEGMQSASEKVNSAIRTDFAGRARFFDRNPLIAEAMVDKDIIIVWREGKVVKLDKEEQVLPTDQVISAKGKLLTLNADQMIEYGVADILLEPKRLEPISEEEKIKGSWPLSKTLLSQYSFFDEIPGAVVDEYQMDWKTRFFVLLANPLVASLLSLGMIIGFYIEINSPGFGVPGGVALLCLFLIILSSFALDVASWLEMILILAGLSLVALDLFVIPSFGIVGIAGIILFLIGLFGMMLPGIGSIDFEFDTGTFNPAGEVFVHRLAWLSGTLIVAVIVIYLLARFVMPKFSGFSRFVLAGGEQETSEGYSAGEKKLPSIDSEGEVIATLRPGGKVMIEGEIYDAVSTNIFLEKGTPVIVTGFDGSTLLVQEKKA